MSSLSHSYSVSTRTSKSPVANAIFRRAPLVMIAVIFTLISLRYLSNTVAAAAAVGIGFASPEGITVARVGFAAFPLAFAILAFVALISDRWRLAGIYMVLTVDCVVIAVRVFSMLLEHSMSSARLLVPEAVLLLLSLIAVRLESARMQAR